jgi:hypothetical protein
VLREWAGHYKIIETSRHIDEVTLRSHAHRSGVEMVLQRTVFQLQDELDATERLPAWQQFVAARQGSE